MSVSQLCKIKKKYHKTLDISVKVWYNILILTQINSLVKEKVNK